MEDITDRISKVITKMKSYGVLKGVFNGGYSLQSRQERHEREREMRETFSRENESFLVGLEKNVERLVTYLVEEDDISQVVSIIGMGGIGKTTLAQQVFNHEIVKSHFENVAWVCVSQEFTRKIVWEKMLRNFSSKHDQGHRESEILSDGELHDKLFGLLETSKSLIVLDDVWKEEDWDRIKPVFPPNKGWKVLLTSRNEGVALRADPKCIILKPECLTPQESWKLFQNRVFPKKDGTESKVDAEMEEIGLQMMQQCGGLPLAIKVLGGLLLKQCTLHEWKRIHQTIGSQLINENTGLIHHVLSLSFEELPAYLKHCFLYFAHFPEDYAIKVDELSYYWAAEEIPKPRHYNGWTILDIGQGYIEELVKRNMVISQRDIKTLRFEECQLHDMMREVCLLKAEQENFLQTVDNWTDTSTANSPSPCRPRRLNIYLPKERFDLERVINNPKLRSLLFGLDMIFWWDTWINWTPSGLCFEKLKLLRVLRLPKAKLESEKLPSGIGKLIHLRYLSLYMATVSDIPSSMRNLKLLLYLNLNVVSDEVYVPNIFKEMQELRYLYLPHEIHGKTKLELGNLVNLETLENFSTKNSNVKDLLRMTRLRTLSICLNSECTMETLSSSLRELRHLERLKIRDHLGRIGMVDATGLVLDCVNLKHLVLSVYMSRLPDRQHFPSCLTSIELYNSCLVEDPMPILEKLVHLTHVILLNRAFGGKRMVCSASGFPKLEELLIYGLEEWEEWIIEERSMPLLYTLTIGNCLKLKELPEGMRFMTSLKELSFEEIEREFKDKVEEGGEDYYKIQHIPHVILPFLCCGESTPDAVRMETLRHPEQFNNRKSEYEDSEEADSARED